MPRRHFRTAYRDDRELSWSRGSSYASEGAAVAAVDKAIREAVRHRGWLHGHVYGPGCQRWFRLKGFRPVEVEEYRPPRIQEVKADG